MTTSNEFTERINPRKFNFSPQLVAIVGAILGHDYGVRDRKGGLLTSISITSDGFVVAGSTASDGGGAFIGGAEDMERNIALWKQELNADDLKAFDAIYAQRVTDWRPQGQRKSVPAPAPRSTTPAPESKSKTMTKSDVRALCGLVGECSYNADNKAKFERLARKLLRELRTKLNMPDADIRYNAGGIAVSGDASLHSDTVYVSFNADGICGLGILYRACKSKKDYAGGHNNFYTFERLKQEGVDGLAKAVLALIAN